MNPKRVFLFLSAAGALAVWSPLGAVAQTGGPAAGAHEHSATVAGIVEWFLPTAGYAYGGDWNAGFLSNGVRIGAFVGLLSTRHTMKTPRPASPSATPPPWWLWEPRRGPWSVPYRRPASTTASYGLRRVD